MDGRHDLTVDPSLLLTTSCAGHIYSPMENSGHQNSQQLRPPSYGDLCRPPGAPTDSSTLSAAYHSRYLASLPISSGSSFPFFNNMFTGTLPTPPSPFRAPSAPGVGSMRQFWPPTPPPDGYGRYGMNTSLFPMFSSVSPTPESAGYVTQGLVSRLNTAGHLSHLIDGHKEKHLGYGHMTLGTKELEVHEPVEFHSPKAHLECCKSEIPSRYGVNVRSKTEKQWDKAAGDYRKASPSCVPKEKQEDLKPLKKTDTKYTSQSPSKVSPCEIDVTCAPNIKPDVLSPPIDSPKSDIPSSPSLVRKQDLSPSHFNPTLTNSSDKYESHCLSCMEDSKGVDLLNNVKLPVETGKVAVTETSALTNSRKTESDISRATFTHANSTAAVSTLSITTPKLALHETTSSNVKLHSDVSHLQESTYSCHTPRCSPLKAESSENTNPVFQEFSSNANKSELGTVVSKPNTATPKHVTAAVIPTAPKQSAQRDLVSEPPDVLSPSIADKEVFKPALTEISEDPNTTKIPSALYKIKLETTDTSNAESLSEGLSHHPSSTNCCKPISKHNSSCKVKDMIKAIDSSQKVAVRPHNISNTKDADDNTHQLSSQNQYNTLSSSVQSSCASSAVSCSHVQADLMNKGNTFSTAAIDCKKKIGSVNPEVCKAEIASNTLDYQFPQANQTTWTKATVLPFNWQKSTGMEEQQAINLSVSKKTSTDEASEQDIGETRETSRNSKSSAEPLKSNTVENNTVPMSTGIIGVCHPNTKTKTVSAINSCSKLPSTPQTVQPEITTEVHVSLKASLQTLRHNSTPPICMKNNGASPTFQNKTLKPERLATKRSKLSDNEKLLSSPRTNLATLAPKLTKKIGFLKDGKPSHTLSTSSSMSSTSIVFPASVNPCIPVGIAIAQQRQDSSATATIGKTQPSIPSVSSGIITSTTHLSSNHIATEMQPSQEIVREQKTQDIVCSNSTGTTDSSSFLVAQGPTIVSRQWESEAVTRATLPSPWVTHGPVVAPALWIGQGTYATTTAPASASVPTPAPINSLETSPISLPPGGYQLARDSVTGHLFLIPAANIVDRTSVWPSNAYAAGNTLPIQQLVTQQHHAQFEQQVLPQVTEQEHVQDCLALSMRQAQMGEPAKDLTAIDNCCLPSQDSVLNSNMAFKQADHPVKMEEKIESSSSVPSVPLASGQTFAFTTFPTNCDPSGFSYVLQSSTVMHLAHTQTTASIQTESGKRSQGTSPLHCATPSPPPPNGSLTVTEEEGEDDEESDNDSEDVACTEITQVKLAQQCQSVTMAIQVDMDCQTNSEAEEDEEVDIRTDIISGKKVEMSDFAIQTEVLSDSGKTDFECDPVECSGVDMLKTENFICDAVEMNEKPQLNANLKTTNNDKIVCQSESPVEIVTSEVELAPSLPVESKPVMDFIDHHGLNLLVDSIEEFASREKDSIQTFPKETEIKVENVDQPHNIQPVCNKVSSFPTQETVNSNNVLAAVPKLGTVSSPYRTIDTSCTDGLGLLCALAEQRFFEESLNTDAQDISETSALKTPLNYQSVSSTSDKKSVSDYTSSRVQPNSYSKSRAPHATVNPLQDPFDMYTSATDLKACELEMRKRLADLQREYKEKQLELARLKPKIAACSEEVDAQHTKTADHHHSSKPKVVDIPHYKQKSDINKKQKMSYATAAHKFKVKAGQQLLTNRLLSKKSLLQKKFKKSKPAATESSVQESKDAKKSSGSSEKLSGFSNSSQGAFAKPEMQRKSSKSFRVEAKVKKTEEKHKSKLKHGKIPNLKISSQNKNKESKSYSALSVKGSGESKKLKQKGNSKSEVSFNKIRTADSKSVKKMKNISESKEKHGHLKHPKTTSADFVNEKNNERPKVPFFDEQAWFVRRSERIFLSDAKPPVAATSSTNNTTSSVSKKPGIVQSTILQRSDSSMKEKKENASMLPQKCIDVQNSEHVIKDHPVKIVEHKISSTPKSRHSVSSHKKRHVSESSAYSKSSDMSASSSSTDGESSDEASSQSDNVPLSILLEKSTDKGALGDKPKRLSTDSDSSDVSSASSLSEDIPLSILLGQNNTKVELKSCILTPTELQDKVRVLILEEGLFYAGHITAVEAPDVYGIILDGERAHRPHIFSREEILNAAILEVNPTHTSQVPEGSRICAFWSQQYRCLYPGTVTKASSPLPDPSLVHVEFDDGDSGRISLEDIRMLPPDFPIVSMEPNPLLILGKRRARADKENALDNRNQNGISSKGDKCPIKLKKKKLDSSGSRAQQDFVKSENSQGLSGSAKLSKSSNPSISQNSDSVKSSCVKSFDKTSQKEGKVKIKESKKRNRSECSMDSSPSSVKPKKHKKHKDDHKHHHHHHHHHHRHHKKHKSGRHSSLEICDSLSSAESTVISMQTVTSDSKGEPSRSLVPSSSSSNHYEKDQKTLQKKSELTMKIKTSPSPHTTHDHGTIECISIDDSSENSSVSETSEQTAKQKKAKRKKSTSGEAKPVKRKERVPSVEKSKIAAFLPVRQLWRWSGKSYRRPGAKGKAKKEFYRAIQRGKELLRVGDSAVFLSTGRPHLPYIGRIETMWESWGGKMDVKVKWFYHPEETKNGKKLTQLKGALFQSPHFDENDVQTISHKCEVLSWDEYQSRKAKENGSNSSGYNSLFDNNDTYYLAGTYDPITGVVTMEPGVPKIPALALSEG